MKKKQQKRALSFLMLKTTLSKILNKSSRNKKRKSK